MKKINFVLIFTVFTLTSWGNNVTDSLYSCYTNPKNEDTTRFLCMYELFQKLGNTNTDSVLTLVEASEIIIKRIDHPIWYGKFQHLLGSAYQRMGRFKEAIVEFEKGISILEKTNATKNLSVLYHNLGLAYERTGDPASAIDFYLKSLEIKKEDNDYVGAFHTYMNIGIVHKRLREFDQSIKYYNRAKQEFLKITNEIDSNYLLNLHARLELNIGNVFKELGKTDSAMLYYNRCKIKFETGNDLLGQSIVLGNLGGIAYDLENKEDYLKYTLAAVEIKKARNDVWGLTESYESLGFFYEQQGDRKKAIYYCEQSLALAVEMDSPLKQMEACDCLFKMHKRNKSFEKAMNYLEQHDSLQEIVMNENNTREITTRELNFEFEKEALVDSLAFEDEKKIRDIKIAKQDQQKSYLIVILLLLLLFGGFIYNRYRITKKQKLIIEKQEAMLKKDFIHLKEFAENASHEIQTPMAIIQSKLDSLMQSPNLTEEHIRHIVGVSNASQRLSVLNRSLLLLAKIENNQFNEKEEIDMSIMLQKQLDGLAEIFVDKGLQLSTSIDQNTVVQGNHFLSTIIVSNLLKNAIAHNVPNGTINIDLTADQLKVENTGKHLAVDPKELFKRFKKEGSSYENTGLGLAIVQKACAFSDWSVQYEYADNVHSLTISFRQ